MTGLVAVIGLVWAVAIPTGDVAAAPPGGTSAGARDASPGGSGPAGPSLTGDPDDPVDDGSTTTYDSYTTVTRPDDEGDMPPVPLAATGSVPRTTVTTRSAPTTPTVDICIDPTSDNTARCVTTTGPGPGATGGVCDTSVGRTTDPGCTGATAVPTTPTTFADPCGVMTTLGCPGSTTTGPVVPPPTPPPSTPAPSSTGTAPPVTCFPVACPATTRLTP